MKQRDHYERNSKEHAERQLYERQQEKEDGSWGTMGIQENDELKMKLVKGKVDVLKRQLEERVMQNNGIAQAYGPTESGAQSLKPGVVVVWTTVLKHL